MTPEQFAARLDIAKAVYARGDRLRAIHMLRRIPVECMGVKTNGNTVRNYINLEPHEYQIVQEAGRYHRAS